MIFDKNITNIVQAPLFFWKVQGPLIFRHEASLAPTYVRQTFFTAGEMYPTCVSSKLCEFIFWREQAPLISPLFRNRRVLWCAERIFWAVSLFLSFQQFLVEFSFIVAAQGGGRKGQDGHVDLPWVWKRPRWCSQLTCWGQICFRGIGAERYFEDIM